MTPHFSPTLIFDLDGTLVDSAITITDTLNKMRSKKHLSPLELEMVKPLVALGADELIEIGLPYKDVPHSRKLKEFRTTYLNAQVEKNDLFDGVEETLTTLKSLGIKLAICTNKPRLLADKTLNETGIASHFDCVVCGCEAANNKPSPDQLFLVMQILGSQSHECLFIGDTRVDYSASLAAEISFIYFPSGYDKDLSWTKGLLRFPTKSLSSGIIIRAFQQLGFFSPHKG